MSGSDIASKNRVQYLCNECNIPQTIVFTPKMKEEYILNDPEFKVRGLALYTATHPCLFGILGANNLYIDHNLHVRSYKYLNLPAYKIKKKTGIPMPATKADTDSTTKIHITHIIDKGDLNMTVYNDYSESLLIFGHPDIRNATPLKILRSDNEMVLLRFYYSKARYTSQMERWLLSFVNIFEYLPPSRLGLVIEVLQFILDGKDQFPSEFDENIIKMILASHEVFFELNEMMGTEVLNSYGTDEAMAMKEMLLIIQEDPLKPLHQFSTDLKEDVVFIIYCFLILERHGCITVHRPGIITGESLEDYDLTY